MCHDGDDFEFWDRMTVTMRISRWLAAVLLMIAAQSPALAAPADFVGTWRVSLALPGGALPFGLEIKSRGDKLSAVLLNPPERMAPETLAVDGDVLTLGFPSYGAKLVLRRAGDGLAGEANMLRNTGPVTIAATGTRGTWRFVETAVKPAADLSGRWQLRYGDKGQKGEAVFRQSGSRITGAIQLPSGDFRYLAGDVSGDQLKLSTFDGNAATLWTATIAGGTLTGAQFTATGSKTGTAWTATRAPKEKMEAVTVEAAKTKRFQFRFPDSKGNMVSLADPQFRGKVVVVTLGGAWCPNCHDEARFMGPYAAAHKAAGLEVVALHFEYGTDTARNNALMDSYARRYKLAYPLLLAGEPNAESTAKALPGVGPVKVYPTTLFIGRDGTLREVHVGWAGPAMADQNARAKAEFDALVTKLLREKA
jgi:peroxiredoxin